MKLLLFLLLSITCFAQDPFVNTPVFNPVTLYSGQTAVVTIPFGNAGANPISVDSVNQLTYTFIVFPYERLRVTSFTITAPTDATYTPDNLTVTQDTILIPFNPPITNFGGSATRLIIKQKDISLPMPGQTNFNLAITILPIGPSNFESYASGEITSIGISANNPNNDRASYSVRIFGPMPVSLVSFTAKAQQDQSVGLSWTTSLETNNKGFLIERSKDLEAFEKVGEVTDVAINSSALTRYSLTDHSPYRGTSYYRLTQFDLSDKPTTFPAVSVVLREGAYGVFPNPVSNDQPFRVSMDEPETARVTIYGVDGRAMPFQKVGVEPDKLLLKGVGKLSEGIYILNVDERGQTRRHRLVVE